jgi:hypothetical protein
MPPAIAFPRTEGVSEVSKARLEAEAAFEQRPQRSRDKPVVVVKRKRSVGVSTETHTQSSASSTADVSRTPRVFRVESVLVVDDNTRGASKAAARPLGGPTALLDEEASNTEVKSPKRHRRRDVHGKITIIRPERTTAFAAGGPDRLPIEQESSVFSSLSRDSDLVARYDVVMAEIEALRRKAVELRKIESAGAVRWIKRAIADYDLTAEDLGF